MSNGPYRYQIGKHHAPDTIPPDPKAPCGRGCCWTPYSCAKSKTCACHMTEQPVKITPVSRKREPKND